MTRRWPSLPRSAGALILALAAACADAPTSPDAGAYSPRVATNKPDGGGTVAEGVTVTTFEYLPNTPTIARIGEDHSIAFAPWAICDPATAGYGPDVWNTPCAAATTRITITARSWRDAQGHPRIEFSPALRFSPARLVTLYIRDRDAARDPGYTIVYCGEDGQCIDESATDPTLVTHRNLASGVLWRRIRHFSSYNVAARAE
jgi:hypothetical protein